jgi:nucleotide-binding universal stress UspA family protein
MTFPPPTIVCAVDGSPESVELVRISARLAEILAAGLECVHVLAAQPAAAHLEPAVAAPGSGPADDDADDGEVEAHGMLDGICDVAGAAFATRRVIRYGDPARRIAAIADQRHADLIVVGTRSHDAAPDAVLGSVSRRLAADAPCPVLVIPPNLATAVRPERWPGRTLVCGLDGSEPGWSAAGHAAALAARLGGSLMTVSVGSGGGASDEEVADRLQAAVTHGLAAQASLVVRRDVRQGDPAWELERVASAISAPLIAIGSRGLGPFNDGLLGSIARRLLRAARRPILIFPATSMPDAGA